MLRIMGLKNLLKNAKGTEGKLTKHVSIDTRQLSVSQSSNFVKV